MMLYQKQCEVIWEMAEKSDCVIVGRCADHILREHHPFRFFVCAIGHRGRAAVVIDAKPGAAPYRRGQNQDSRKNQQNTHHPLGQLSGRVDFFPVVHTLGTAGTEGYLLRHPRPERGQFFHSITVPPSSAEHSYTAQQG